MEPFFLPLQIVTAPEKINYPQKILLTGSCFTEHIGNYLTDIKLDSLQNPHGILFDPLSVASALISYIKPDLYRPADLFLLNELWQSWDHHGVFSDVNQETVIRKINQSQTQAHDFLEKTDWLLITLGSSFTYFLKEKNRRVANCHRAPAGWFNKKLLSVEEMLANLDEALHRVLEFNPRLKIIFTISPVRHIRDGVVENNRSKARLIEVVHQLVNKFNRTYYFPAYELVIDVLRDYRFYDRDLVHPNYAATQVVVERFADTYLDPDAKLLSEEIRKLQISKKHRALHPDTDAHRRFMKDQYEKTRELSINHPDINFDAELAHFKSE